MESFDYIVVGAGSSGCAVAGRLSEKPGVRVLLLEAGPPDTNPWIHIPIGYAKTIYNPDTSRIFKTEPCDGVNGRVTDWPRGWVIGGCSSINGLVYIRGQRQDYDQWRQLGNAGWGHDDVLPYFKKAQDQQRGDSEFHGRGGPLTVSDHAARDELAEAIVAASREIGLPANEDFNGATQEGVGYYQLTTRKGRRCSAAVAYLGEAKSRANLKIETNALAQRVLFEGTQARSITYKVGDQERTATATREIVLCGGAINSPQLLQLSGVGPADVLKDQGIGVVRALAGVGENLQDHFQVRTVFKTHRPITANDELTRLDRKIINGIKYALFRTGMLTIGAGQVGIFVRTRPELETPDVQYHYIPFAAAAPGQGLLPFSAFTMSSCQLRPESRGTVHIRSADPSEAPAIQPNYLATETDCRTTVDGIKLSRRICAANAVRDLISGEHVPGKDVQSDDEILDYARSSGITIFHPAGTCKMGPASDAGAVVDERLRVHGFQGLRVADCSIMPTLVSGNTNAPAIMIGEKAAAMMLSDAGQA